MSLRVLVLLLLALLGPVQFGSAVSMDEFKMIQASVAELKAERIAMTRRLQDTEMELKRIKEVPKVAFAVSLGDNGMQKTTSGNKDLIYRDVLTNVGQAYNPETGEFTAPVRGVYYIRFTVNAPTDFTMSGVLYKNDAEIQLIVHEAPSGRGSDTGSNGAPLMLEKGDKLKMVLWHDTQIWDNSNHHSTFSGYLLFPMDDQPPANVDIELEMKALKASVKQLQTENLEISQRLNDTEKELKEMTEVPKVAFAASLGGNGMQKTTSGNKDLIYRDVLTNIGQAYNAETGEFTAPVRGVYYIRFTVNAPTDFTMSGVLYKNDAEIQLIVHEAPSGRGSDTGSNGAPLMLEKGDKLKMVLWHNTQIWDNSNHHSTFSGYLLFPM